MKKWYVEMFKVITVGLMFSFTALQAGVVRQSFHYDDAGRLIEVRSEGRPELSEAYRYDASGNIIEKRQGSDVIDMSYDKANQLKSRSDANGTVEFVYDSAGRLVEERQGAKVLASYEYGYLDKVTAVTRGKQVTKFHYNARGMLVGKERNGKMIETMGWDGIGLLAKGDTVYANEAHISGGVPLMSIDQGESAFYDHDYLGTTTASYNQQGETDVKLTGSLGKGTNQSEVRFTGKSFDEDLGAHVFPFRNYRSELGRWASADPAGFPDGPNQHFYAPVPTTGLDPFGLSAFSKDSWHPGEGWSLYRSTNVNLSAGHIKWKKPSLLDNLDNWQTQQRLTYEWRSAFSSGVTNEDLAGHYEVTSSADFSKTYELSATASGNLGEFTYSGSTTEGTSLSLSSGQKVNIALPEGATQLGMRVMVQTGIIDERRIDHDYDPLNSDYVVQDWITRETFYDITKVTIEIWEF